MTEELLTLEQVAQRLDVSPATARRWAASGRIPAKKVGKQWMVREADLPLSDMGTRLADTAQQLLDLLDYVRATGYSDKRAIREVLALHAELAPVYRPLYGGFPQISTNYPPGVWWPRARENALQALAALEGGLVDLTAPSNSEQATSTAPLAALPASSRDLDPSALTCFVIGPIGDSLASAGTPARQNYEEAIQVYGKVIREACAELGIEPIRADEIDRPGEITEQIVRQLRDADVVIADVTGANPNVMYELGIRHVSGRITIPIGEQGQLPFDIRAIRTIPFERSLTGFIDARNRLAAAIAEAVSNGSDAVTAARVWAESSEEVQIDNEPTNEDDQPGFLELLAETEDAWPDLVSHLEDGGRVVEEVGTITRSATKKMNDANAQSQGGAKQKLAITIGLAKKLDEPTQKLEEIASQHEEAMARLVPGLRYLLDRVEEDPSIEEGREMLEKLTILGDQISESSSATLGLANSIDGLKDAARPLRATSIKLSSALRRLVGSWHVLGELSSRATTLASNAEEASQPTSPTA